MNRETLHATSKVDDEPPRYDGWTDRADASGYPAAPVAAPAPAAAAEIGIYELLTPVVRGWYAIAVTCAVVAIATAALVWTRPREYRASVALSTVVNPRTSSLGGGIGALLNQNTVGGLQSTPALIVLLSHERGVLERVAAAPVHPTGAETIAQRLASLDGRSLRTYEVTRRLGALVQSGFDRQTGVINIELASRDSAFARAAVRELVDEISRTFLRASKAQGAQLRQAMTARLDSAARELRRSQEALRAFRAANRQVGDVSPTSVEQQNLERDVTLAQSVYTQAVNDRESAVARELEDTPAVVVLDPLSAELPPEPRRGVVKLAAAVLAALIVSSLVLLLRDGVRRAAEARPASVAALGESLHRVPLIGRLLAATFALPRRAPVARETT